MLGKYWISIVLCIKHGEVFLQLQCQCTEIQVFWLSLVMALLNLSETVSSELAEMLACFLFGKLLKSASR